LLDLSGPRLAGKRHANPWDESDGPVLFRVIVMELGQWVNEVDREID
jgi:hypothetical protein